MRKVRGVGMCLDKPTLYGFVESQVLLNGMVESVLENRLSHLSR